MYHRARTRRASECLFPIASESRKRLIGGWRPVSEGRLWGDLVRRSVQFIEGKRALREGSRQIVHIFVSLAAARRHL
jgi:hypothetical protein